MTDVVVGEKKIGRPVRLKQRRLKTIFAQFVFVRVNQIDIGMRLQKLHNLEKSIRLENIIMIEKNDPLAAREGQSSVQCCGDALVALKRCETDPSIPHAQRGQSPQEVGSGRSIVDQHELPIFVNLREH